MTALNKYAALREAANAANIASWGKWEPYKPHKGARGYEVKVGAKAVAQHCLKVDSAFIAAANPATVLALLDELETKAEQRANWFQMAQKLGEDLDAAEKRIEEETCRANREHHRGFMMACNHLKDHANVHYADAAEMEIAALRQRIAELEHAQSLHVEDAYMLCGQFDELAAAMGWTSEIAVAQGVSQLEYARNLKAQIAELSASHSKLRDTMATIHNTIRMDGGYTPLAAILNAAKRAHEESATAAGIGVKGD